jgi:hypothetical protein
MTIEDRLKMVIGDLVVQNQMLLLQLEKSQEKQPSVEDAEKKPEPHDKPKN